jgi:hypothetical protein
MEKINLDLPFTFINDGGDKNISTEGFAANFYEVHNFYIERDKNGDPTKQLSYYPNGFAVYIERMPGKIVMKSSHPIVQNGDGTYEVQFDPDSE